MAALLAGHNLYDLQHDSSPPSVVGFEVHQTTPADCALGTGERLQTLPEYIEV